VHTFSYHVFSFIYIATVFKFQDLLADIICENFTLKTQALPTGVKDSMTDYLCLSVLAFLSKSLLMQLLVSKPHSFATDRPMKITLNIVERS